jgi:benzylsuccinate CoA-transferase BbsF subunit
MHGNASGHLGALGHLRICDLSGQLAGAGATRFLAAFGAQVIRIEDPVTLGLWDIVRQMPPLIGEDRSHEAGAGFFNHNVEKLGITLNLRTEKGKALLRELVRISDAVTENFAAGVMERLGFGFEQLRELRPDVVYVSNCGFGQTGPYSRFKSWGPIAQAVSGMTFQSGLPGREPAGWGYSYMDHTGAYHMAIALLAALYHRARTGEGQWVDLSCTEAGASLNGPAVLDATVNGRALRRDGMPNSNRSASPAMAPHGVFPAAEDDSWLVLACRDDDDWARVAAVLGIDAPAWATLAGRLADEDRLEAAVAAWTRSRPRDVAVAALRSASVPVAPVLRPSERSEEPSNLAWGLWPEAEHARHGVRRVDGVPIHLSSTDWRIERAAPLLGQDNERVLCGMLGVPVGELEQLRDEGVI